MKIDLQNETHWRNDHIRAFVARVLPEERPDLCKRGASALKVKVVYTRRDGSTYSSGYAYYHSNFIKVRLPKNYAPDKIDFAMVIAHELAHTRGMKHDAMRGHPRYRRVGRYREIYAWATELPLEVRPMQVKAQPTADAKLAHAEKMLKAAMTREKRATTLRKKWQQKVKYYQKKAAEAPKEPQQPIVKQVAPPECNCEHNGQHDARMHATTCPLRMQWDSRHKKVEVQRHRSIAEILNDRAGQHNMRVEGMGGGDYDLLTRDGYNFGDGSHLIVCHSPRDVVEMINTYKNSVEPCGADCDCKG